MKMEDNNITGNQVLELIKDKRKSFHNKARFPNAILIHPGYYSVLKQVLPAENRKKIKRFSTWKYLKQKMFHQSNL